MLSQIAEKEQRLNILRLINNELLDHNVHTPFPLCREIINQLDDVTGKNILVLYSYEMAYLLVKEYNCDPTKVTLVGQATNKVKTTLAQKLGINYCDVSWIKKTKSILNMKFDVIIGNPPYNKLDSDTVHRTGQTSLLREFFDLSFDLATEHIVLISPYSNRTYGPSFAKKYKNYGLNFIKDCQTHFPQVKTNPCAFFFNLTTPSTNLINEMQPVLTIPAKNLGDLFVNQPGHLTRSQYESKLKNSGKYTVVVTTSVVKYTDDLTLVNQFKDKTRGNWRVVMNVNASLKSVGKVLVANPDTVLSASVNCLIVKSEQEANTIRDILMSVDTQNIMQIVKTSSTNSKKYLQYIVNPFG